MVQRPEQDDDQKDDQQRPDKTTIETHARFASPGRPVITADGCWADYRTPATVTLGRPCLFLDRDGVLIEDIGYPHRPDEVVLIPETISIVVAAQQAGFVTGIVSNQSGIGRGFFDWTAFASVQAVIDEALHEAGARLDFVMACPHHADAALPDLRGDHAWRKPRPGMLTAAHHALGLEMTGSIMIGDRASDIAAAFRAGVPHRLLLDAPGNERPHPGVRHVSRFDVKGVVGALLETHGAAGRYERR